jgi:SWI/SNF-related matrix-associated actin-dependent regulator of chromatin subfamily A protein 2/4
LSTAFIRRVLLFSTMTKLLDLLEVYLQWRQLPEVNRDCDQ